MPQLPQRLNGPWMECSNIQPTKLYVHLCYLAYLQNEIHPCNDFKHRLKELLMAHPNVDVAAMGFPGDWESQPLWE